MKFKLEIEEVVTFRHEIIVEADSESEIDQACDSVENEILMNGSDYAMFLKERGFNNIEFIEDGSGDSKVECTDLYETN